MRERYTQILDPSLALEPMTRDEENRLLQLIVAHGSKWSLISRLHAPRRSPNFLKNSFNRLESRLSREERGRIATLAAASVRRESAAARVLVPIEKSERVNLRIVPRGTIRCTAAKKSVFTFANSPFECNRRADTRFTRRISLPTAAAQNSPRRTPTVCSS